MSIKDQKHILPDVIHLDMLDDMTYLDPFTISKWNNEKLCKLSYEKVDHYMIQDEMASEQQEIPHVINSSEELAHHNCRSSIASNTNSLHRLSPIPEISDDDSQKNVPDRKSIKNKNKNLENDSAREDNYISSSNTTSIFPSNDSIVHDNSTDENEVRHISAAKETLASYSTFSNSNSNNGKVSIVDF